MEIYQKRSILGSSLVKEKILMTCLYIPAVSEFGKKSVKVYLKLASHLQKRLV